MDNVNDNTNIPLENEDSEVEVFFWTKLKDDKLNKLPDGTFMIQTNSTRRELSQLLNQLLGTDNISFDFLIEEMFLRTTISEYMKINNKTSESKLSIEYVLTINKPFLDIADKNKDWIRSVCSSIKTDNPMVITGCYDGVVRFYDILSYNNVHVEHKKHKNESEDKDTGKSSLDLNINELLSIEEQDTSVLKVHSQQLNDSVYSKVWVSTMNGCIAGIDYSISSSNSCKFNVKNIIKKASFFPIEALCTFGKCENIISAGDANGNIYVFSESVDVKDESENKGTDVRNSGKNNYKLENVNKLSLLNKNKQHSSSVTDLMSNGEYLLSASLDGNIKVTNIYTGESVCGWNSKFPIFSISSQYSSSGNVICTSHDDGKVRIWDIRSGNTSQIDLDISKGISYSGFFDRNTRLIHRCRIFAHKEVIPCAQWNPFSDFIIGSVSHDKYIKILDIRSTSMPLQVAKTDSKLLSLCWVSETAIYTGGSSGELIVCTF
ncbi:microtubule-associated ytm1 [Cryptosporidium xiaoi]|uniref:Microtubule-associated ytm1 n=1 Tax=Cryptosporidium xiaoi TaxID=659607 RepID=A0AAV9XZV1_9CRYT